MYRPVKAGDEWGTCITVDDTVVMIFRYVAAMESLPKNIMYLLSTVIFLQSNALYNLIIPSGTLFVTLLFTGMVMTQEVEWVVF